VNWGLGVGTNFWCQIWLEIDRL